MTARILLLLIGTSLLVGCATEPKPKLIWVRPPGITMEQARQDAYACRRDAEMLPTSPIQQPRSDDPMEQWLWVEALKAERERRDNFFETCLHSKGYTQKSAPPKD
jgi:hypothetical protein